MKAGMASGDRDWAAALVPHRDAWRNARWRRRAALPIFDEAALGRNPVRP